MPFFALFFIEEPLLFWQACCRFRFLSQLNTDHSSRLKGCWLVPSCQLQAILEYSILRWIWKNSFNIDRLGDLISQKSSCFAKWSRFRSVWLSLAGSDRHFQVQETTLVPTSAFYCSDSHFCPLSVRRLNDHFSFSSIFGFDAHIREIFGSLGAKCSPVVVSGADRVVVVHS